MSVFNIKIMQIYHYRNDLDPNGWTPFSLTEEDGKKWNLFCRRLALSGRDDMYPYFDDYLTFLNELKVERNIKEV